MSRLQRSETQLSGTSPDLAAWYSQVIKYLPGAKLTYQDIFILCLASMIAITIVASNITTRAPSSDGRQNLKVGLHLAQEGDYGEGYGVGYHRREPFFPMVIAALDSARMLVLGTRAEHECATSQNAAKPECVSQYSPYKILQPLFLAVAALSTFFVIFSLCGSRLLAYFGFGMVWTSAAPAERWPRVTATSRRRSALA